MSLVNVEAWDPQMKESKKSHSQRERFKTASELVAVQDPNEMLAPSSTCNK